MKQYKDEIKMLSFIYFENYKIVKEDEDTISQVFQIRQVNNSPDPIFHYGLFLAEEVKIEEFQSERISEECRKKFESVKNTIANYKEQAYTGPISTKNISQDLLDLLEEVNFKDFKPLSQLLLKISMSPIIKNLFQDKD